MVIHLTWISQPSTNPLSMCVFVMICVSREFFVITKNFYHKWFRCNFLFRSVYMCISVPICLWICLFMYESLVMYVGMSMALSLSDYLCTPLSYCLSLIFTLSLSVWGTVPVRLTFCHTLYGVSLYLPICPSFRVCPYVPVFLYLPDCSPCHSESEFEFVPVRQGQ